LVNEFTPYRDDPGNVLGWQFSQLLEHYRRHHRPFDLRELAAVFQALNLDPNIIGQTRLLRSPYWPSVFNWEPEAVWPYFAERLEMLAEYLQPSSVWQNCYARKNVFAVLCCFPQPPPTLTPLLWELAFGAKGDRQAAQECVEKVPDHTPRIIAALVNRKSETRTIAAEWLARLRESSAVDPLLAALKQEKNEVAKGAFMTALEVLGAPVDQFLDREKLLAEADKGLAKGLPADLQWLPVKLLPLVHWADNGQDVPARIIQWFIVQSYKLKNPEPGPLLRRYCAGFMTGEREALGQFVLQAWLAEDTLPIAPADAEKQALQQAQTVHGYQQYFIQQATQNPQVFGPAPKQQTVQEIYAALLGSFLKRPKGSAISSKGILAVAAACCGAEAAPLVARYLKEWYGQRTAQCRALLQMLAWVEHPMATQVLLATGNRFRTKGIQAEATKQAQALAERKGWTLAELADRTIPSAGFDENGELELDYGPRKFIARLGADFSITLVNPEGKIISSLPDARQGDDEVMAKEAKAALSAARKELKSVIQMQRDRLYEAMCTQRTWAFEDWSLYLNQHPIVRHFCQRLVWVVSRADQPGLTFRPLADGTLTDTHDETVSVTPEEPICLGHDCNTSTEVGLVWRQHFEDYKVEPLFEQFGKKSFGLAEEQKQETEVRDFLGWMLESFKLRGKANKLGYTRGQAQDAGWFYTYHKRFSTLGMEAVIEFTGNPLPEENRKVALRSLYFDKVQDQPGGFFGAGAHLMLGEVPAVLLSECWNDLRLIAAEGPGFDPEWEKKSGC
jgi:hypothetical protein